MSDTGYDPFKFLHLVILKGFKILTVQFINDQHQFHIFFFQPGRILNRFSIVASVKKHLHQPNKQGTEGNKYDKKQSGDQKSSYPLRQPVVFNEESLYGVIKHREERENDQRQNGVNNVAAGEEFDIKDPVLDQANNKK
ncbi:hypothetical protein ES703_39413 [subsurface metagenome]